MSQTAIRNGYGACPIKTVPAGEIEGAVVAQLRGLLRTPEIIVRTWKQTAEGGDTIAESEVTAALSRLNPLWDELFPAEQARLVRLLVARATIGNDGVHIDLHTGGLATLAADLRPTLAQETRQ